MRSKSGWLVALAGGCFCAGCLSANSSTRGARSAEASLPTNTRITAAELSRVETGETLLSAVRRLRPWFLGARGGTVPMVVIDGAPALELSVLETIRASAILEVRLLRASSSPGQPVITPTGSVIVGDVLVVHTRRR